MNLIASAAIERPGLYRISAPDYFGDPCPEPSLTQSLAKVLIERSPAHAAVLHPRLRMADEEDDTPEKYDKVKAIGDAAHRLLLGRGKELAVGEFDAWTTKEAKAFRADAQAAGRMPILSKHVEEAMRIVSAARIALDDAGLEDVFRDGEAEVCAVWEEDGIWLRTLVDWLAPDLRAVTDLKTTGLSVAPHHIGRLAADAGWDIQAAMHERALAALDPDGRGRRTFRFVAVEQERPYALSVVEMPEAWLTMGRKKLDVAIRLWRRAMETDSWPSYPVAPITPEYPGWQETRWLEREVTEFSDLKAVKSVMRDKSGREMSVLEAG